MGLNLCIGNPDNGDEPQEWDSTRHCADHEFASFLFKNYLPAISCYDGNSDYFRPEDIEDFRTFEDFRDAIRNEDLENNERFMKLADILEQDENWYIYVSF